MWAYLMYLRWIRNSNFQSQFQQARQVYVKKLHTPTELDFRSNLKLPC